MKTIHSALRPVGFALLMTVLAFLSSSCSRQNRLIVGEIPSPAPAGSVEPNLTVADNGVLLSWVEPVGRGARALRFSRRSPGGGWSTPLTVYSGSKREDSPSEVPSVVASGPTEITAAWTQVAQNSSAGYQEDVFTSISGDGGRSWAHPQLVNQDHTVSEHGYVSLATTASETPAVLWLDGRDDQAQHRYHLLTAAVGAPVERQTILDDDVCTCCPTALVHTAHGLVAAYRDHTADNIRDISVVRSVNGRWTSPTEVSHDQWHIDGCPTNGPALATDGQRVALAWFTAAHEQPVVKVSFSADEGATWSSPKTVSETPAVGRAAVALFPDGSALVGWVTVPEAPHSAMVVRRVTADGKLGPIVDVGQATSIHGRIKLASWRNETFLTWVEEGSGQQVRVASIVQR